jgi:hypothetical protein
MKMKINRLTIIGLVAGVLVLSGIIVFLVFLNTATTLEITLEDSVSGYGVWDSTIILQDRIVRGYHSTQFLFTGLSPGQAALSVSAPDYTPYSAPVTLNPGKNTLAEPVRLQGLKIRDLDHFYIFEEMVGSNLAFDLRPADKTNQAVVNHPCINIRIVLRICKQTGAGQKGLQLFAGVAPWKWNPDSAETYRYSASIPAKDIRMEAYPWVIDYLIVVPDPLKIGDDELKTIVDGVFKFTDEERIVQYLDGYKDRFRYYISTNWDIVLKESKEGGAQ